ncbi:Uncaracterized surface protein containing fasciclin (FAS1) repeats [Marivirga sericea]|uniref:Uncaracterized surface protein containing fasciclin (FAS1) repeats n=1 Tax=Marivirga sericea TaxID=1028 RepID=A0A1X7KYI8_9BACT|nr:fasciclin domain-containing protein [Marivirga sericea]SMG46417.1 Uncaracterized surface protein containing fasciclin (FAS1) repeats [Marivirga sericea]
MKRRNIILCIGIIVASIIGTKSFAHLRLEIKPDTETLSIEEVDRIIKTIENNPEFSMFYEAINKASLSEKVAELSNMTLMIPTNKAFRLLPEDVWENFMDEDNKDALVELLSYHVIPKKVLIEEFKGSEKLTTLQNQPIQIFHGNELKVENATIEGKYDETNEVIIYKIDRLIMPL